MAEREERIETLFHAALELNDSERTQFLAMQCGEDQDMRREIESLLELDGVADTRLDCSLPEALSLTDQPVDLMLGKRLGPYRLDRRIAAGGMGAVYEATQEDPRRTVAVKVLRPEMASEDLARRFRGESSFLARLRHPGIAHIYDTGVAEIDRVAVPYIAMELVDGARTILEFARESRLERSDRLELFAAICDAVHHGHQRGVIHRDLKPGNVLIDSEGRPKLIDFGVARAVDSDAGSVRTEAGVILGTVRYMSPEQWVDSADLDVRSDVYSLGVMLYELMCDRPPHDLRGVPLPEAARVVQRDSPLRPGAIARELRGDIETILLKALEKDRRRRYQSADALASDLHRFLRHEPIDARTPSFVYRALLFTRRRKALVGSLATVFVAAIGTSIISTRYALAENKARLREERSSAMANIATADLSLQAFDPRTARNRLSLVPPEHRGWAWRYLRRQLDLSTAVIPGPKRRCEALDFHAGRFAAVWHYPAGAWLTTWEASSEAPVRAHQLELPRVATRLHQANDGTILWGGFDGGLRRWDPARKTTTTRSRLHDEYVTGIRATRRGEVLSTSIDGTVRLWNPSTDEASIVFERASVEWRDLAISPDESLAAVGGDDGTVVVLRIPSGAKFAELGPHAQPVLAVAFDPKGEFIASGSADNTVRVWNLATGIETRRLIGHLGQVNDLVFLRDGVRLVSASADRTVRVWDVPAGRARTVLYGHDDEVKCLAASDDGAVIASGGFDGSVRLWSPTVGGGGRRLDGHTVDVRDITFARSGRWLASASHDHTAIIYEFPSGRVAATLEGHRDKVTGVAFDPLADRVATASKDGSVRLWEVPSGRLLETLDDHTTEVLTLAFSGDGSRLATGGKGERVLIYETAGLTRIGTLPHEGNVEQIAFSPTGHELATITNVDQLRVWDTTRGLELWRVATDHVQHDLEFSPDGATLATASGGYGGEGLGVALWDARTGDRRGMLEGHTRYVLDVAFSRDGERIASASADGTIGLWDTRTREEILVLRGDDSLVWAVEFSPDGDFIVSGTNAGVRLWDGRAEHR